MTSTTTLNGDGTVLFPGITKVVISKTGRDGYEQIDWFGTNIELVTEGSVLKLKVSEGDEATLMSGLKVGDKVRLTDLAVEENLFPGWKREQEIAHIHKYSVYVKNHRSESAHYSWFEKI